MTAVDDFVFSTKKNSKKENKCECENENEAAWSKLYIICDVQE